MFFNQEYLGLSTKEKGASSGLKSNPGESVSRIFISQMKRNVMKHCYRT